MNKRVEQSARGFTILELTVAIGAFVLLSVGLMSIVNSVSKVVKGGKKLSRLNTIAQLIEYRVRDDISKLDPSSFLVVRQQLIDGNDDQDPDPISISPDDVTGGRARRVDEILFFTTGEFKSRRAPLSREPVESGQTARVYYGHGQPRGNFTAPEYLAPSLSDEMIDEDPMGVTRESRNNSGERTRYASSWILTRQLVWLAGQRPLAPADPDLEPRSYSVFDLRPSDVESLRRLQDNPYQIDYRPAVPSLFRSVNYTYPRFPLPGDGSARLVRDIGNQRFFTLLSSGVVDIAATDMSFVRDMIYGSAIGGGGGGRLPGDLVANVLPPVIPSSQMVPTPLGPDFIVGDERPTEFQPLDVMHAWMNDLFPAASVRGEDRRLIGVDERGIEGGVRTRAEVFGPDTLNQLSSAAESLAEQRNLAILLSDLEALQTSNLLVGCTEFIVDWSFGESTYDEETGVYRQKWYGPRRYAGDTNDDGAVADGDWLLTRPYGSEGTAQTFNAESYVSITANVPDEDRDGDVDNPPYLHPVTPRLIYGFTPSRNDNPMVLTSFFGDTDPTYTRQSATELMNLPDVNDPEAPAAESCFWKWPSQLRFKISLTDPDNPDGELQFAFVVTLPSRESASSF
jgi:type II secretory pathway pseudopilin PulG